MNRGTAPLYHHSQVPRFIAASPCTWRGRDACAAGTKSTCHVAAEECAKIGHEAGTAAPGNVYDSPRTPQTQSAAREGGARTRASLDGDACRCVTALTSSGPCNHVPCKLFWGQTWLKKITAAELQHFSAPQPQTFHEAHAGTCYQRKRRFVVSYLVLPVCGCACSDE